MDTVSIDSRSLYSSIGSPFSPLVLDVRSEAAFAADDLLVVSALPVYDGLYAWCRSQVAGDKETHSWNVSS